MLILPPGHYREVSKPRGHRRPRERIVLGFGALLTVIVAALVVFSLTTHQKKSGHGCIDFNYMTMIGGAEMYRCGEPAKSMCLQPSVPDSKDFGFQKNLDAACHKAGLAVGKPSTASSQTSF